MSVNRENVIWQSENGTWSRGFYDYYAVNQDSPDWDYEWDVEYTDDFAWVSTGHPNEEAAEASWKGSNPGGSITVEWTPENAAECAAYDAKARECKERDSGRFFG